MGWSYSDGFSGIAGPGGITSVENNTNHTVDAGRLPAPRPDPVPDLSDVAEQTVM